MNDKLKSGGIGLLIGLVPFIIQMWTGWLDNKRELAQIEAETRIKIETIRAGVPNNNKNVFTADTLNTARSLEPQKKKE